jgi:NodT family efflux transporter outer membrane factor (OMF) lipoprotein
MSKSRKSFGRGGAGLNAPVRAALLLVGLAGGLGGCKAVGPDYQAPELRTPRAWASAMSGGLSPGGTGLAADGAGGEQARWWSLLQDPVLVSLVERVVAGNPDLRVAEARVREARAAWLIAGAGGKPNIDATGDYSRSTPSENTGQLPEGFYGDGRDLFQGGFDASWELDVFGATRRSVEAARADLGAAQWAKRDVLVSLIGETARQYVELRTAQRRLAIARENQQSQRQTLELTQSRLRAGITSELDVTQARGQLATTTATLPVFEAQAAQAVYALSVLTGRAPGALVQELVQELGQSGEPAQGGAIPLSASGAALALPVGVPMDLVRRRPDVRRAERELAAATARVGVATAELYPSFSLRGAIGLASSRVGNFFEGDSRYWSIAPGVRWNLLDFGRVRSRIQLQEAGVAGALASYEGGVLRALREVDSAIVGFTTSSARREALAEAVAAQKRAVEIATDRYRQGLSDFISVLDAQRQLLALQDQEAESLGGVTLSVVQLYKSLGGGWEIEGENPGPAGGPQEGPQGEPARGPVIDLSDERSGGSVPVTLESPGAPGAAEVGG